MRKNLSGMAAAILIGLLAAGPVKAADYVMKFGIATMNEAQHNFTKMYKEALEKASAGRIEVQIYPNSQLGPIPREIESTQFGTIQAYMGPVDFFVGIDPRFGVFSAPMLFRDEIHAAATIHDPSLEVAVLDLAEAKNLMGMAMLSVGASNYAARVPLMTIADFKGKKLRINGSELERQKMSRLGATGVALPLSEVMPALSQGVIDGTISATSIFVAFKMIDLVKTVTVTNDTMLVTLAVVSKLWLDKLPPDLRKLVIDTGLATQGPAQAWEQDFSKRQEAEWNAMGGTIHKISPADQAQLKTMLATVGDDATRSQPPVHEMLEKVRATAAKF